MQGACTDNGHFVDVAGCDVAGIAAGQATKRLFMRQETVDTWRQLERGGNVLLQGPPGTGKSVIAWAWACHTAQSGGPVRWVHVASKGPLSAVDLKAGDAAGACCTWAVADVAVAQRVIAACESTVLVLDGLTTASQQLMSSAMAWQRGGHGRRVVVVSSMQLLVKGEELEDMALAEVETTGWTLSEYQSACGDASFFQRVQHNLDELPDGEDLASVTPSERVEAKFFLAGHCARWMFALNAQKARADIRRHLERVPKADDLLQGLNGNRSVTAVNHLLSMRRLPNATGHQYVLVSEHVARQLASTCDVAFVTAATRRALSVPNAAFDGLVLEMDFFCRQKQALHRQQKLTVTADGQLEEWAVPRAPVEFYSVDDLAAATCSLADGDWLNPSKPNQGCYDAAQLVAHPGGALMLRVVQVTRGRTHTLKLQYLLPLLRVLQAKGLPIAALDVVVLVPAGHSGAFRVGAITSDKCTEIVSLGWAQEKLRTVEFQRSV